MLIEVDQLVAPLVARHQHGAGLFRVIGQPARQQLGHVFDLLSRREHLADEDDAGLVGGRIRLWIVGAGGADVGRSQGPAAANDGIGVSGGRPVDQMVGQGDDRLGAAAAVRQVDGAHTGFIEEAPEKLRVGGGERLVDGLIRIAHADPVAIVAGQKAKDALLKPAAVLRFSLRECSASGRAGGAKG